MVTKHMAVFILLLCQGSVHEIRTSRLAYICQAQLYTPIGEISTIIRLQLGSEDGG